MAAGVSFNPNKDMFTLGKGGKRSWHGLDGMRVNGWRSYRRGVLQHKPWYGWDECKGLVEL